MTEFLIYYKPQINYFSFSNEGNIFDIMTHYYSSDILWRVFVLLKNRTLGDHPFVPAQRWVSTPCCICHTEDIRRLENGRRYWSPAHRPQLLPAVIDLGLHEDRASRVAPTSNTHTILISSCFNTRRKKSCGKKWNKWGLSSQSNRGCLCTLQTLMIKASIKLCWFSKISSSSNICNVGTF